MVFGLLGLQILHLELLPSPELRMPWKVALVLAQSARLGFRASVVLCVLGAEEIGIEPEDALVIYPSFIAA